MTKRRWIVLAAALLLPLASGLGQVTLVPGSQGFVPNDDPASYQGSRQNLFATDQQPLLERAQKLRERLSDPVQRAAVYAELRVGVEQLNPGVGEFLLLDAETERRLIDLLTEQSLEHQLQFADRAAIANSDALYAAAEQQRQITNRHSDQVRELLGLKGMERYNYYQRSRYWRSEIVRFGELLGAAEQLRQDQQLRLLDLLTELDLRFTRRATMFDWFRGRVFRDTARPRNIEMNERTLYAKQQVADAALAQVAEFLQPAQVRAYARWEADKLNRRMVYVQQLRTAAGLPADLEPPPADFATAMEPASGKVRMTLDVRINGTALDTLYLVGESGKPMAFDVGDALSAQATPTLFADGQVFLLVRWFERGQTLSLPLGVMGLESTTPSNLDAVRRPRNASQGTTLHGNGHYELSIGFEGAVIEAPRARPTL